MVLTPLFCGSGFSRELLMSRYETERSTLLEKTKSLDDQPAVVEDPAFAGMTAKNKGAGSRLSPG
jgi:hypothetical protein